MAENTGVVEEFQQRKQDVVHMMCIDSVDNNLFKLEVGKIYMTGNSKSEKFDRPNLIFIVTESNNLFLDNLSS